MQTASYGKILCLEFSAYHCRQRAYHHPRHPEQQHVHRNPPNLSLASLLLNYAIHSCLAFLQETRRPEPQPPETHKAVSIRRQPILEAHCLRHQFWYLVTIALLRLLCLCLTCSPCLSPKESVDNPPHHTETVAAHNEPRQPQYHRSLQAWVIIPAHHFVEQNFLEAGPPRVKISLCIITTFAPG